MYCVSDFLVSVASDSPGEPLRRPRAPLAEASSDAISAWRAGSPSPNAGPALQFARCMRAHGVPNWPDPTIDSQGRPVFAISISKDGFNPYSPPIWAKGNHCSHLMPDLPGAPFQVSP